MSKASDDKKVCDCHACRAWRYEIAQMREAADEVCSALSDLREDRQDDALAAVNALIKIIGKHPALRKDPAVIAAIRKFKSFEQTCTELDQAINQWTELSEMLGEPMTRKRMPVQNAPTTARVQ